MIQDLFIRIAGEVAVVRRHPFCGVMMLVIEQPTGRWRWLQNGRPDRQLQPSRFGMCDAFRLGELWALRQVVVGGHQRQSSPWAASLFGGSGGSAGCRRSHAVTILQRRPGIKPKRPPPLLTDIRLRR